MSSTVSDSLFVPVQDMSIRDVVSALSADPDDPRETSSIHRCVQKEWLKARRVYTMGIKWAYAITAKDLVVFLKTHGATLDVDPPPGVWRDILQEARRQFDATYISRPSLFNALGTSSTSISRAEKRREFQSECFRGIYYYRRDDITTWIDKCAPRYRTRALCAALGLDYGYQPDAQSEQSSVFSAYHARHAPSTLGGEVADLERFAFYLRTTGIVTSGAVLQNNPHAWTLITSNLILGFIQWQMQEGYTYNTVLSRYFTVRRYAKLAVQSGTLVPEQIPPSEKAMVLCKATLRQ